MPDEKPTTTNDDITEVLDRTEQAIKNRNREKDQELVEFWYDFLFQAGCELYDLLYLPYSTHPEGVKDG